MTASAKRNWLDWVPIVGMLLTIAGLIWAGATYANQINDNTRRIQTLEANDTKRSDTLNAIDTRTARIEGYLLRSKERP